jgi:signal transduction histidine kinase
VTAHEFRTPLSIALFQLEDMFYEHKHEKPVVQDLKIMESSLKNLKNLMQKFFDVQQYNLDKVKLVKTKINIYEYLENVYADFIPVMKNKNVQFSFENNLKKRTSIQIDPSMIRQVLTNLLDNAAKFAKKIKLEVKEDDNKILIRVIDNGPGVPDKDKEKIFGKFEDLEFSRGMGIGLGLYICRKIIELHKGEIFVQDTEGGGATMIVKLKIK